MNKLLTILKNQINQEITRLEQVELLNWEKEQTRLTIYQQLVQII